MIKKRNIEAGTYRSLFRAGPGYGGVVASDEGLLEVFLPVAETADEMASYIARLYPRATGENEVTGKAAALLRRYFAGEMVKFDVALDRRSFTEFQRLVYTAVADIPYGAVRSYAEVAAGIGRPRASRGVGTAMASNPLPVIVPCHRVIGAAGDLTGYSGPGGVDMKKDLLRMEGVPFRKESDRVRRG